MATMDEMLEKGDERLRDEQGRFTKADESEAPPAPEPELEAEAPAEAPAEPAPPPPEEPPKVEPREDFVPQAALMDERRKRQQYEQQLQALQRQLEDLQKPKQEPVAAQPPGDFWDDPQGFVSAAEKRAVEQAEQRINEQMRHQYATMCETIARSQYQDYDETRDVFLDRVKDDPVLRAELARAENPALFAYQTGKRLKEYARSPDDIRKEIEAKVRAELAGQAQAQPQVPQSLNTETSPAASSEQWAGPTPLSNIIGIKR